MLVAKHKWVKDGPAICAMVPELYKFMGIYRRNIRPHFARPDEEALLVINKGKAFKEGTIWCRMKFFAAKCDNTFKFVEVVAIVLITSTSRHTIKQSIPKTLQGPKSTGAFSDFINCCPRFLFIWRNKFSLPLSQWHWCN